MKRMIVLFTMLLAIVLLSGCASFEVKTEDGSTASYKGLLKSASSVTFSIKEDGTVKVEASDLDSNTQMVNSLLELSK